MRSLVALTVCAALGSGVVAGVFFAFSTFVMPALARLPPEQGIAAMQSINVTALNRWFMSALFGTAGLCVWLAVASLKSRSDPGAGLRLGGSALYLVGAILVTIACNVPRNEALAAVRPDCAEAAELWARFLTEWVAWNHVRTGATLAACALLILAQLLPASGPLCSSRARCGEGVSGSVPTSRRWHRIGSRMATTLRRCPGIVSRYGDIIACNDGCIAERGESERPSVEIVRRWVDRSASLVDCSPSLSPGVTR
jgi:uncharacterized membrane protein